MFRFRDEFGQWDPKNQRPELWSLYNGRIHPGESIRVFPLSNWTELDIWHYIGAEELDMPVDLFRPRARKVFERDGMLYAGQRVLPPATAREPFTAQVRYRTVGDAKLHRRGAHPTPNRRRRSSPKWPSPGSPSAAPPAATTASARRRWKIANKEGYF